MATQKQIDANRRNALKSTGPKTAAGRAAVRLNALKFGLRARTIVLPGESQAEFDRLCDDLQQEWQPRTRTEQFYLEQMAVSQWKLTRTERAEKGIYDEDMDAEKQTKLLDRIWTAQHRMERAYNRAQRELERLQEGRGRKVDTTAEPIYEEPANEPVRQDQEPLSPRPHPAYRPPQAPAPLPLISARHAVLEAERAIRQRTENPVATPNSPEVEL